jgi:hypothetical protein
MIEVRLSGRDLEDIRERTFADPEFGNTAVRMGTDCILRMSLDDIEVIQGYVAAEANHAKDRRLRKRLDQIFDKLQKYLDTYEEADASATLGTRQSGSILAFRSSATQAPTKATLVPMSILQRLLDEAGRLGSDLLEIRYKDGHEEVFATIRGHSYRIATIRSTHPDAVQLREELVLLATGPRRSVAAQATGLLAKCHIRVSTYDDFGETAYRVELKRE